MRRPPRYVSQAAGLEYIEMPKSGCTSIKAALLQTDGHTVRDGGHAHCHNAFEQVPDDWRPRLLFTFVRHPFDRLVSNYCEKLQKDLAKRLRGKCPLPPNAPFLDWARWVCTQDPATVDRHWRPAKLLIDHARRKPQAVYRFEGLAHYWETVLRPPFAPLGPLPHMNPSPGKKAWTGYYCPESADLAAKFYAADLREWRYQLPATTPKPKATT